MLLPSLELRKNTTATQIRMTVMLVYNELNSHLNHKLHPHLILQHSETPLISRDQDNSHPSCSCPSSSR